jgi:hypothetical protein
MKTATGVTLLVIGAILLFAVHGNPGFVNLHVAGLVLMFAAAAGLWLPRQRPGWGRRQASAIKTLLTPPDIDLIDEGRVPLEDLLGVPSRRRLAREQQMPAQASQSASDAPIVPGMPAQAGDPAPTDNAASGLRS